MRQYLRCREEFWTGILKAILLAAFGVTMVFFARTIGGLFEAHGAHLSPWYRRLVQFGLGVVILLIAGRIWAKIRQVREVRQEMAYLQGRIYDSQDSS